MVGWPGSRGMEEVGGALKGVHSGSDARESVALGLVPRPATWLTLAFLPLKSVTLGQSCPRSRVILRVCAGAAGAISPVGWAVEPESARARPWRAAARGAAVSGRRR